MKTKNYIQLSSLIAAFLLSAPASAATIYDNAATAQNINMLTWTFLSYAHKGETLSDFFKNKKVYGTMTRIDEYGDDGSTLKHNNFSNNSEHFIKNVWLDATHINGEAHYDISSKHARFTVATLGATTKPIDLYYGRIYFGTFAGYINSDVAHIDSNGALGGIFAHYGFNRFGANILIDTGSLNNNTRGSDFNSPWVHAGTDVDAIFYIDETFLVRPGLAIAYTFLSSDDLYVNGNVARSDDFNFWNIAPSVQFVKEIVPNWYGSLTAKYIAHFGGDNDIHVSNTRYDGINIDNYTELNMGVEYDFRQFVFSGQVQKQIGGFDGWAGNINVKYNF